jgi:hypothetical protein
MSSKIIEETHKAGILLNNRKSGCYQSFLSVCERNSRLDTPWLVLCGMRIFTGVVISQSALDIFRKASIKTIIVNYWL